MPFGIFWWVKQVFFITFILWTEPKFQIKNSNQLPFSFLGIFAGFGSTSLSAVEVVPTSFTSTSPILSILVFFRFSRHILKHQINQNFY